MESTMTEGRVLSGIEFARAGTTVPAPAAGPLPSRPEHRRGGSPAGPRVVHFHGGGWRMGERSSLGPVLDGFGISAFRTAH